VLAALLVLAGCGSAAREPAGSSSPAPVTPERMVFQGQVLVTALEDVRSTPDLEQCVTRGPSRDIGQGTRIEVRDDGGRRVAAGALDAGRLVDGQGGPAGCSFFFFLSGRGSGQHFTVSLGEYVTVRVARSDASRILIRVP
jgi:hypothetical protein